MKIEDLPNYGMGLVDFASDPEFKKFKKQMVMPFMKRLYAEVGFFKMAKILMKIMGEKNKINKINWTKIEGHGFKKENMGVLEDIIIMKALVNTLGKDKAYSIFSKVIESVNETLSLKGQNVLLIPIKEIKSFKDQFIAFKEFTKAAEIAMKNEGSHIVNFVQDTENVFAFDVNYCVAHEVASELGDPDYCFSFCHIDDVAFPKMGEQIGFKYERESTLRSEARKCVFKFSRI